MIGLRFVSAAAHKKIERLLNIRLVGHLVIKSFASVTVVRLCKHDDNAAFFDRRFRRRHAFYRLVNILIERIAAVRRYDDVRRQRIDFTQRRKEIAAFFMCRFDISCNRIDRFFFFVDDDVDDKREFRRVCRPHHIFVNRISFEDTGTRMHVGDEFGTVICKHSCATRHAGKHAFAPARKTGKKMRFDKAFRDEQIRFYGEFIDNALAAARQRSDFYERRIVAVVNDDFFVLDDLFAEFIDEFFFCRKPVTAGRNENRNVGVRVSFSDFGKHRRNDYFARNGARMIACDEYDIVFPFGEFRKFFRTDGIFKRFGDKCGRRIFCRIVMKIRNDDAF